MGRQGEWVGLEKWIREKGEGSGVSTGETARVKRKGKGNSEGASYNHYTDNLYLEKVSQ